MAFFTSYDGGRIYYEKSEVPAPRAVVQILTGLGEMALYYTEFTKALNEAGYSVWLHEHRGHGRTEAPYCRENLFFGFAGDAAVMNRILREENPGLPVILFGHSLGTNVGQYALNHTDGHWDGIVFTGPSHGFFTAEDVIRKTLVARAAIERDGPDAPSGEIYEEIFNRNNDPFPEDDSPLAFITTDPEKRAFIASLPYTSPPYSNRFFLEFMEFSWLLETDALEWYRDRSIPVLILVGEKDPTCENGRSGARRAALMRKIGFSDVTDKIYPGLRHSLLQETRRREVTEDILGWLGERF